MSLNSLISPHRIKYEPYKGQNKSTGGMEYGNPQYIQGRLGSGNIRYDSQEAVDSVAEASLNTTAILLKNSRVTFQDQGYLVVDSFPIIGKSGQTKFYNYILKSLDNAQS